MRSVALLIIASAVILSACGSTGIVKMEEDHYMVSEKNAKLGYVNAAEEKASVYRQANAFCEKQGKQVKTINLDMVSSGSLRSASATLDFSCETSKKTE